MLEDVICRTPTFQWVKDERKEEGYSKNNRP
jgi:hypothetical protein